MFNIYLLDELNPMQQLIIISAVVKYYILYANLPVILFSQQVVI